MFEELSWLLQPRAGNKLREGYFMAHHPEYYAMALVFTKHHSDMPFNQRFWHLYHKQKNKPRCPTCDAEITVFTSFQRGYNTYCNPSCQLLNPTFKEDQKKRNLEKYGVESTNSLKSVGEKRSKSWKAKEAQIRASYEKTMLARYGTLITYEVPGAAEKAKASFLARYGVDHNMKSVEGFMKQQKAALKVSQYKNTNLTYQGSYELLFLEEAEKYLGADLEKVIKNPESIKYTFEGEEHYYFPDYLIIPYNLLVEIKSYWTLDRDGADEKMFSKNCAKWDATRTLGFTHQVLIEKEFIKDWAAGFFGVLFSKDTSPDPRRYDLVDCTEE